MSTAGIPGKILVHQFMIVNDYATKDAVATDIWPIVDGMSIYESIFTNVMYGVAKVQDSLNLYNTLPITSESYIKLGIQDPTTNKIIQKIFRIYKISNVNQESPKIQSYILHFASIELYNSKRVRVSKKINGNIPQAIQEIHAQISKKPLAIDEDQTAVDLIIPMMSALNAINFLAENAKWKSIVPDYCYWETFNGFNYKSLASCYLNSPLHDFSTNIPTTGDINNTFSYQDFIKIDEVQSDRLFDSIQSLYTGNDGLTIFNYNPKNGSGELHGIGEEYLSQIYPTVAGPIDYISLAKRKQILRNISDTYYYIKVPGLLSRSSGDMADVIIYNGNRINEKDAVLSGRRLICGIVHVISKDEYSQNITLGEYLFDSEELGQDSGHK